MGPKVLRVNLITGYLLAWRIDISPIRIRYGEPRRMVRPSANRISNAEMWSRVTAVATGTRAVTPGTPLQEPAEVTCPSVSTTARS
jgi:hypothetical protein